MTTPGEPMSPQAAFYDLARRMMYIHDPDNVCAFLMSYRSYEAVGADLCNIWCEEYVKAYEKEQADEFRRAVKKRTSERMLDFLEIWITRYDPNFTAKEGERLMEILKDRSDPAVSNKFKLLLVREREKDKEKKKDKSVRLGSTSQLRSPKSSGEDRKSGDMTAQIYIEDKPSPEDLKNFKFDLLELYAPSVIAKQLTLYEWEIFKQIKPEEFLNQNWTKEKQHFTVAPNITRLTEHFNKVSMWVAVEILSTRGRYQTKVLRKFISMAYNCLEMNNYNTALEILAGLNHSSIQRLKAIWEKLPDRENELYKNMDILMQPRLNYRNYRKDLSIKPLPAFPTTTLICRDFTYIYDGNPRYNSDGSINFDLPMLLYERVKEIERYQSQPYDYQKNERIFSYFPFLSKFDEIDEDYLHNLSLESQPSMWAATTTIVQDSEETGSENTPGHDEESDSASSESGSSRYIKAHQPGRGETRTSDVDAMAPPGGSPKPSKTKRRIAKEDDDTSSGSSLSSDSSWKKSSKKSASRKGDDGSEDSSTPRRGKDREKEKDSPIKKGRKREDLHLMVRPTSKYTPGTECQAVKVPPQHMMTFYNAEVAVNKFFSQVAHSNRGSLTIGNKRYLLIRASALSVEFFSSIRKTFTFSSRAKGDEFFRKLLFNFGQIIAKSDVRTLARAVNLKTPIQMFAAGPIYQSFAGLGFAEISADYDGLSSPRATTSYTLVADYRVSCEAVAWRSAKKMYTHPCCHLLNGYISGWASGAYGLPLVGVEVLCATKGDKTCRTLLCSPEKAKATVKSYASSQNFGEELKSKVQIPSLITPEDAELYEEARKDMNEKQKKTFFEKNKKLLNTSKISKEELDAKERKLLALERKSMHYFSCVYAERHYNWKEGQVLVGEEPYVFIRGKAISKGFVELVAEMFSADAKVKATDFAFDFLFDLSNSIGKADYRHCMDKLARKGRDNLHPLKKMIGLKKAFANLGWGCVKYDFRTANLVYNRDDFFIRFMIDNSFESSIWMKAKEKLKEEEEARKEVEEAAQELAKLKGMTLEEAFRKLEKANKTSTVARKRKASGVSKEKEGDENDDLTTEVTKSPVCVMCAGFANGFMRKCFKNKEAKDRDLDLVVVEVACRAAGHPACEFLVCSKNMVMTSVKTYLKEKNQTTFGQYIKYYNVMRKKKGGK